MLCDRHTTNVAKSQVGFINFVIVPYYKTLSAIFPALEFAVNQAISNKEEWATLEGEYETKMREGNKDI